MAARRSDNLLLKSVAADAVSVAAKRHGGAPEARVRERGTEFAELRASRR
jgi:hypothetical protein